MPLGQWCPWGKGQWPWEKVIGGHWPKIEWKFFHHPPHVHVLIKSPALNPPVGMIEGWRKWESRGVGKGWEVVEWGSEHQSKLNYITQYWDEKFVRIMASERALFEATWTLHHALSSRACRHSPQSFFFFLFIFFIFLFIHILQPLENIIFNIYIIWIIFNRIMKYFLFKNKIQIK